MKNTDKAVLNVWADMMLDAKAYHENEDDESELDWDEMDFHSIWAGLWYESSRYSQLFIL